MPPRDVVERDRATSGPTREVSTPAGTKTVDTSAAGTRRGGRTYDAPSLDEVRAQGEEQRRSAVDRATEASRQAQARGGEREGGSDARALAGALSRGLDRAASAPALSFGSDRAASAPALSFGSDRAASAPVQSFSASPPQRRTSESLGFGSPGTVSRPALSVDAPLSFGDMPSPVDPLDLSLGQTMRFGMPTLSLDAIKAGIVAGEVPNAADPYNTLLNYSNQPGMPFSNVNLTGMTVQEVLDFQRKRGPGSYASYAQNLPNVGRIATPAGKYQIVGDTLQGLVDQGVLDPNEKFGSEAQERAARALMEGRGLSAYMEGQLSEEQFLQNLSKEWEGFKPDVALGYGGTGGQTVSSPDGLPMSMGVGSPSDRLRASSSPAERTGIAATLGALGPYNTATYQNLPKEQRAAAIAASMLMPGAGLVQALGYRMNDREMQAAASMLEGKYEPRKGLFGIGADPKFERAEPVYDERTGQLVGAIGYDAKGSPVVYRGQRQGVQYSGPGADLVSSADDRSPGDGMGGEGQASVPGQESAAEPEAAIPNDPAAISIECPPGFRFDPATGSCQAENPWPTYRPPTPSERPPLTAYREVPDFQLQPLLPYPSGGIASL